MKLLFKMLSCLLCIAFLISFVPHSSSAATDSSGAASETTGGGNSGTTVDPSVPTAVLTVAADRTQACPGEQIAVTLSVAENSGIVSGTFTLSYDNTKLTYVTAEGGALLSGSSYAVDALESSVALTRAPAEGLAPIVTAGSLMTVVFSVKEGTEGQTLSVQLSASGVKGSSGEVNLDFKQNASCLILCKTHEYEGEPVISGPNCEVEKTSTQHCKRCNRDIVTVLSGALGHAWSAWSVVTPATCSGPGKQTRTCANAGCPVGTETAEIQALPHVWDANMPITLQPTCLLPGSGTGTCTVCKIVQQVEIPALGHVYGSLEVTAHATCTQSGAISGVCDRCKVRFTVNLPETGHYIAEWKVSDAVKCLQPRTRTGTCLICKQTVECQTSPVPHEFGSPVVLRPATETEYGEQQVTCSRCGETTIQLISPVVIDPVTGLPVASDSAGSSSSGGGASLPGNPTVDGGTGSGGSGGSDLKTLGKEAADDVPLWILFAVAGGILVLAGFGLTALLLLKKKDGGRNIADPSPSGEAETVSADASAAVVAASSRETEELPSENASEPSDTGSENAEDSVPQDGEPPVTAVAEADGQVDPEPVEPAEEPVDPAEDPAPGAAEATEGDTPAGEASSGPEEKRACETNE